MLDKVTLIRSCLFSIPNYMLSFLKFPKWAIALVNSQMAKCMWSNSEGNKKNHLPNWPSLCIRNTGVMGVPNIEGLNMIMRKEHGGTGVSNIQKVYCKGRNILEKSYRC